MYRNPSRVLPLPVGSSLAVDDVSGVASDLGLYAGDTGAFMLHEGQRHPCYLYTSTSTGVHATVLSVEAEHSIRRLTRAVIGDDMYFENIDWSPDDMPALQSLLMRHSKMRVVPGGEGSYLLPDQDLTSLRATDAYQFAFTTTETTGSPSDAHLVWPAPPSNYRAMLRLPELERDLWVAAMERELAGHMREADPTFTPFRGDREGLKVIPTMWIYKRKSDGSYKARLVVLGNRSPYDPNPPATSSPTASRTALLTMLVIAQTLGLQLRHLDTVQAFVNAPVPSPHQYFVKVDGLPGWQSLLKCLYGMPFSGREWWVLMDRVLQERGFIPCPSEPCVYVKGDSDAKVFILLYVDDLLIATKTDSVMTEVVHSLTSRFHMNDLGAPTRYLGFQITRTDEHTTIHQRDYILTMTERYGLALCRPVRTPMDVDLVPDLTAFTGIPCAHVDIPDDQPYNTQEFQGIVGSLLYCSTSTRPDIARAMSIVCSKASAPTYGDWRAALRILQYLRSTCEQGLCFTTPSLRDATGVVLTAYADSSLAPDWQQGDGYSVTGYVLYLCGGPILWHSAKQTAVARGAGRRDAVLLVPA